jgi:hypothetical protein
MLILFVKRDENMEGKKKKRDEWRKKQELQLILADLLGFIQ